MPRIGRRRGRFMNAPALLAAAAAKSYYTNKWRFVSARLFDSGDEHFVAVIYVIAIAREINFYFSCMYSLINDKQTAT